MTVNQLDGRINSFTGLKAISLFCIFWWHSPLPAPPVDLGARMCELLFVCSGFLVGYNNKCKKSLEWSFYKSKRYIINKIVMFYPLHVVTFIISIINIYLNGDGFHFKDGIIALYNLLLLQSWNNSPDVFFSFNGVSWFLASLMFCYLLTPVFLHFIKNLKTTLVLFPVVFVFRCFLEWSHIRYPDILSINIHVNPLIRCLEFFMGMLLIPLFYKSKEKCSVYKETTRIKLIFSFIEIVITVLVISFVIKMNMIWPRCFFVMLFCVLVFVYAFDCGIISKLLSIKILRCFSKIQFEFYLFHGVLIEFFSPLLLKIVNNKYLSNAILFMIIIFISNIYILGYRKLRLLKVKLNEQTNLY